MILINYSDFLANKNLFHEVGKKSTGLPRGTKIQDVGKVKSNEKNRKRNEFFFKRGLNSLIDDILIILS